MTISIISLCTMVFAGQLYMSHRFGLSLGDEYGFVPAVLTGDRPPPGDWSYAHALATVLTSAFLHGSVLHLLGNMYFFWIFGRQVEDSLGRARYVAFVLALAVAAALAYTWSNPHSTEPCIGASGFISGVMGAYLLLFPTAKMQYVSYGRVNDAPAWMFLGFWIAKQLYFASHPGRYGNEHIAFWAHVGGFVSGVLLSWCLWKLGLAVVSDKAASASQP